MKATELRIGNWINAYHNDVQVMAINSLPEDCLSLQLTTTPNRVGATHGGMYYPIPLTEEWLVKLDFPEDGSTRDLFGSYDLWFERVGDELFLKSETHQKKIDFVHDAQNIYFQIKGEELTIK